MTVNPEIEMSDFKKLFMACMHKCHEFGMKYIRITYFRITVNDSLNFKIRAAAYILTYVFESHSQ